MVGTGKRSVRGYLCFPLRWKGHLGMPEDHEEEPLWSVGKDDVP